MTNILVSSNFSRWSTIFTTGSFTWKQIRKTLGTIAPYIATNNTSLRLNRFLLVVCRTAYRKPFRVNYCYICVINNFSCLWCQHIDSISPILFILYLGQFFFDYSLQICSSWCIRIWIKIEQWSFHIKLKVIRRWYYIPIKNATERFCSFFLLLWVKAKEWNVDWLKWIKLYMFNLLTFSQSII